MNACLLLLRAFSLFRFTYWRWALFHHHLRIVEAKRVPLSFITSSENEPKKNRKKSLCITTQPFSGYCGLNCIVPLQKGMFSFETHKPTNFYKRYHVIRSHFHENPIEKCEIVACNHSAYSLTVCIVIDIHCITNYHQFGQWIKW